MKFSIKFIFQTSYRLWTSILDAGESDYVFSNTIFLSVSSDAIVEHIIHTTPIQHIVCAHERTQNISPNFSATAETTRRVIITFSFHSLIMTHTQILPNKPVFVQF